jgi:uncharacterized glyoxalase superfamily protein PhnB
MWTDTGGVVSPDEGEADMAGAKAIPDGYHTITPHLVVRGGNEAIDFYGRAFGAEELARMPGPDGRLMHAELQLGDSKLFLADEFPEYGNCAIGPQNGSSPVTIHLYVSDVDAAFERAVAAGATEKMPPADMFWGDRYAQVVDPFGHHWSLATHLEDLTLEQMQRRMAEAFAGQPCGG